MALFCIQEDDENPRPKSGSKMDFTEKKEFFQKKIEAAIRSERKEMTLGVDILTFATS